MNLLLHDLAAAIERDAQHAAQRPWMVVSDTLVGADQVAVDEVATVLPERHAPTIDAIGATNRIR